ncbi:MAG TPA: ABC transporter permease subunit, partial [Ktedonobacterales bacterium]|nr:ABC transporter permease subunit [Ktedonobacterales bacterium]
LCIAHPEQNAKCPDIVGAFRDQFGFFLGAIGWLNLLPALLAILVGAPLVARELEHGTHRLAWTQSVTRLRWLGVKLALVFCASLIATALLSLLLTWFLGPIDTLDGRIQPNSFDFEGTVMLGYVAFAMALAIAAGAVLRRAIPAMVVTLAGFLAVRLPIEFSLRQHYVAPLVTRATQLYSRLDWQLGEYWVNSLGQRVSDNQVFPTCAGPGTLKPDFFQCVQAHGWFDTVMYQPASRFWLFQGIETTIFLALAVGLLLFTLWWIRRRVN